MKTIMILCLSTALLSSLAPSSLASTSSEVMEAQRCLAVLGFDPGAIDGRIGTRTADAFARYGASRGLAVAIDPEAVGRRLFRECHARLSPQPMSPRTAPGAEEIPLTRVRGVYELPIEINGVLTLKFILDSGASEVHMPADVVATLIRTGTIIDTDFLPGKTYVLADGSTIKSPRFMLRRVKIGSRRLHNIPASVGSLHSALLLGQSVLEKLGTWGIDSQRQILIIGSMGRKLP